MNEVKFYFNEPVEIDELSKTIRLSFKSHQHINWTNWIKWRFFQNPNSEKAYIAYIERDNKIVSCCTGTPYNIYIDERGPLKFIHTHSGFTHPDYQGLGLFQKTIKALFDQLKDDGFTSEINFCNHNSHASYRKIKDREELTIISMFKTNIALFRKSRLSKTLMQSTIEYGPLNKDVLSIVTTLNFKTSSVHFSRDENFLNWRLLQIPDKKYNYLTIKNKGITLAVIIYKDFNGTADIMEYFYSKDADPERYQLFALGVSFLLDLGFSEINMWSNLHSTEHVELEKFGFQETVFSTYFGVILFDKIPELAKYKKWHYRLMDSDVF